MKQCTKCLSWKDESEFPSGAGYIRSKCRPCHKEYQDTYNKKYSKKNKDKLIQYQRNLRRQGKHTNQVYRNKFLEMYGNKCECCGEDTKIFLALDHKKGTARKIKGAQIKSYMDAVQHIDHEEYRILCHNCNYATRYGKVCPHQI